MAKDMTAGSNSIVKRILIWGLLLILTVLIAVGLIGGALSFVGFPVMKTAQRLFQGKPQTSHSTAAQQEVVSLQSQLSVARSTDNRLQASVDSDIQQIHVLQQEIDKLQSQLKSQISANATAKAESNILIQMDPQSAAAVLEKMTPEEAARTIAQMPASDSGAILADVPPNLASELLSMAASFAPQNQS
ncbi:magnesium transporter MgtE N-terminal domain-containing protein [Alicyclobacillus tolerans]|uniref:Flagellar motility protein MotE, a chaperone for MotC folding n=2 Tax=Alicyclobacillus tolerans TaxID=90970 RepID=A0A1M6RQL3_9BACL|nr:MULTISPECIES: hypothetical protein [Alicyclobacillus]MDP9728847.1 flagellar motility protein MotE (MotC chaperone) [Alicyclobacillus tengchongensis]QRF23719.1 hypothetical protein FY534_08610 [Alicyclobacillus sp. TC]SHK34704.1 Flagellar motility protein MotE, a chaperone for MotC folding [Alicyclobacillus montanus]